MLTIRNQALEAALLLLATPLAAQDWQAIAGGGPSGRELAAMAYHETRDHAVLFGGRSGFVTLGDTWLSAAGKWTRATPAKAPAKRSGHVVYYDSARQVVVLFGGADGLVAYRDTWEWNGTTWTEIKTASAPGASQLGAIAYDATRRVGVYFGGRIGFGVSRETWEFDGKVWKQVKTAAAPAARTGHAMTYDTARGRTVLFGGVTRGYAGDVWEYDGSSWTERRTPAGPSARSGASLAYDATRRTVVLTGGELTKTTFADDTWDWDGSSWYRFTLETKPGRGRSAAAVAFLTKTGKLLRFGGGRGRFGGTLADTWEFGGRVASFAVYGASCSGTAGKLLLTATARPKIGGTLALRAAPTPPNAATAWVIGLGGTGLVPLGSCSLLRPPHLVLRSRAAGSSATLVVPIPAASDLSGLVVPAQAVALDPKSVPDYVLSNAGRAVVR